MLANGNACERILLDRLLIWEFWGLKGRHVGISFLDRIFIWESWDRTARHVDLLFREQPLIYESWARTVDKKTSKTHDRTKYNNKNKTKTRTNNTNKIWKGIRTQLIIFIIIRNRRGWNGINNHVVKFIYSVSEAPKKLGARKSFDWSCFCQPRSTLTIPCGG